MTKGKISPLKPKTTVLCSSIDELEQRKCNCYRKSKTSDWCKYSFLNDEDDFICSNLRVTSKLVKER